MKLRLHYKEDEARDHLVPMSRQALDVVEALRQVGDWKARVQISRLRPFSSQDV
jgi:hypothetical protein